MTIKKYLKVHRLQRKQFLAMCEAAGWKVHKATLSRWISGERAPPPAAALFLARVSGGEIG